MDSLLVYGSYGYTGSRIVTEAVSRGWSPIVAGRDGGEVARQADALGLEGRSFEVSGAGGKVGTGALASYLEDVDAVLNCAGPFVETAEPLVEACLEVGADYLDVTGEFQVFERLRQRDHLAREAGVSLLPGVGFDVVPTDCLAAFLRERLPSADRLALGIKSESTLSRGTALTALEGLGKGGVIRRNGRLLEVPAGYRTREIDFGNGPEHAVTIPFGDVVTAAYSTGIETVEVYAAAPQWASQLLPALDAVGRVLETEPLSNALETAADAAFDGPDEAELATDRAVVWGEVTNGEGRWVRARLRTPNPYALTVDSALAATERVFGERDDGQEVDDGFQTPATAFGSEFVLELEGTCRELLATPEQNPRPPNVRSGD